MNYYERVLLESDILVYGEEVIIDRLFEHLEPMIGENGSYSWLLEGNIDVDDINKDLETATNELKKTKNVGKAKVLISSLITASVGGLSLARVADLNDQHDDSKSWLAAGGRIYIRDKNLDYKTDFKTITGDNANEYLANIRESIVKTSILGGALTAAGLVLILYMRNQAKKKNRESVENMCSWIDGKVEEIDKSLEEGKGDQSALKTIKDKLRSIRREVNPAGITKNIK